MFEFKPDFEDVLNRYEAYNGMPSAQPMIYFIHNGEIIREALTSAEPLPENYELIIPEANHTYGFEMRWNKPQHVAQVVVFFANFKGRTYCPAEDGDEIQYWDGENWKKAATERGMDYAERSIFARFREHGYMRRVLLFEPLKTMRLRYLMTRVAPQEPAHIHSRYIVYKIICGDLSASPNNHDKTPTRIDFPGTIVEAKLCRDNIPEIIKSNHDLLGESVLSQGEPSFNAVAEVMLPIDFSKIAIGRENNGTETILTWNGTLIMVENGNKSDWDHGSAKSLRMAGRPLSDQNSESGIEGAAQKALKNLYEAIVMEGVEKWIDRWFAFATGTVAELVGSRREQCRREYIDGCLPGVKTTYQHENCLFVISCHVTPQGAAWSNVVEVEITNNSNDHASTAFTVVMGRNRSEAIHEANISATHGKHNPWENPLFFEPLPLDYEITDDGRTVESRRLGVIFHSERDGEWGGTEREKTFTIPVALAPSGSLSFRLTIPTANKSFKITRTLLKPGNPMAEFRKYWQSRLSENMEIATPEKRVDNLYKNAISQILISLFNDNKLKYGSYWYEEYYGPEESIAIEALAKWGYFAEAQKGAEISLRPELLDQAGHHYQYRSGIALQTLMTIYLLNRNRKWLRRIEKSIVATAEEILACLDSTQGKYAGLLPKRVYGGDIHVPAFSVGSNIIAWRGLRDAGNLLLASGEEKTGRKFLAQAAVLQKRLKCLIDKNIDRTGAFPFIPMALDIGFQDEGELLPVEKAYASLSGESMGFYWQAKAGWVLRTDFFAPGSQESRWLTDYIEKKGGLLMGLTRIGWPDGTHCIDPHYGFGYMKTLLKRGEKDKFLLSFYSLLAHGMSRDGFSGPEASALFPIRNSSREWNNVFKTAMWGWGYRDNPFFTDPLCAGSAVVALSLLRDMLICENATDNGSELHLLSGIPAKWLQAGERILVKKAPSHFGTLSFEITAKNPYRMLFEMSSAINNSELQRVILHLPHPEGRRISSVSVNGNRWSDFEDNKILLAGETGYNITIDFE